MGRELPGGAFPGATSSGVELPEVVLPQRLDGPVRDGHAMGGDAMKPDRSLLSLSSSGSATHDGVGAPAGLGAALERLVGRQLATALGVSWVILSGGFFASLRSL